MHEEKHIKGTPNPISTPGKRMETIIFSKRITKWHNNQVTWAKQKNRQDIKENREPGHLNKET